MSIPTVTAPAERRVADVRVRRGVDAMAMTCDLPVVEPTRICRPTGRPERRGVGVRRASVRSVRRPAVARSNDAVVRTGHSSRTAVRSFEHNWLTVVLVAGLLAGMAWLVLLIGGDAGETAAGPAAPAATSVVYVRSGESLSSLAERIAPDLPVDGVIAQVRELNGLESSGLVVGQPLVVPDYQ